MSDKKTQDDSHDSKIQLYEYVKLCVDFCMDDLIKDDGSFHDEGITKAVIDAAITALERARELES